MTEHLKLPAELRARIQQEAMLRGKSMEQLAIDVLDERFPPELEKQRREQLRATLAQWREEDLAMSEEESELNAAMMRNIDENRSSYRKLYQNILREASDK
jgi:hypothetical protein